MKYKLTISTVLLVALFLTLAPTILASTTWYVNGVNGSDSNNCTSPQTACRTIGHAIALATSGDTISVAAATYTENLTISKSLKVMGSGGNTTIIDGGGVATVVTIATANAQVSLSNVTVRNGSAPSGGGIYNRGTLRVINSTISGNYASGSSTRYGGGIYNSGTQTISNTTLSGNFARVGGAIYNDKSGTLTISNTTITANTATNRCQSGCGSGGGGINNYFGRMTISNSTVSGNVAEVFCRTTCGSAGGGIYDELRTSTINNSTLSGNGAFGRCTRFPCFKIFGVYGNIFGSNLQNSIVANSPSGGNCGGSTISNGYNMSDDGSCSFSGPGDRNNTDPKLGALQNNGGPTQTMALLPGSPAIDAGNPSGCTDGAGHLLTTDQRGRDYPRHDPEDTSGCDMGAYEKQRD